MPSTYPAGSSQQVNQWMLKTMQRYYLWADQIPSQISLDQNPKDYFKSLLVKDDQFSVAIKKDDPGTIPQSVRTLFGFDFSVIQQHNQLTFALVKMVLEDSPAKRAGLQRGDIITGINEFSVSPENISKIMAAVSGSRTLSLKIAELKDNQLVFRRSVEVQAMLSFNQPLLSKILEVNNDKVGYLYLADFQDGVASSLVKPFQEFKGQNIRHLILDLRYNGGGSVSSAAALCALITDKLKSGTPFIVYKGNKNGGTVSHSIDQAFANGNQNISFDALKTSALSLSEVYIITSANTASAAEVVINNLKPYIKVTQIGDKTLGKDMAAFTLSDTETPENKWVIYPMVYKIFNILDSGNYTSGIEPALIADEYAQLPLQPLGSKDETLLASALLVITGQASSNLKTKSHNTKNMVFRILAESEKPENFIKIPL
ncbi:peptidase S41 [Elizabethkingia miricola]|uniref:PDZ domain-containing protein n=2 Tax=Elizabethkingia bruuniana TaxID=1756149 RepID=A0A7T7V378_9FLAO|nr:peptidase S41 [Elizabethkingia bruuniana]KGO10326.1 peptidase S41 [Elizabethkingia miricola]KUY24745.1 peptidase S41 [Elizabethkingia bruuniana]OPB61799.1 peptidase S41 [Elizabethkingia bruuniana]OPC56856.1 peptidase S41 [Elizabethkingia bruuniana]